MSTKQIIYIDASSLKDNSSCFRKYYLNNIKGYSPTEPASEYRMAYGTAFHKFAENFYAGKTAKDSISMAAQYYSDFLANIIFPEDDYRTPSHLIKVCQKYAEYYQNDTITPLKGLEGRTLVEAKFAIPWFHNENYEFILCGTIDMVAKFDGQLVLVDHKTTAMAFAMADSFLREYELNIQALLYGYIYKILNKLEEAPAFVVNGIFIKKPTEKAIKEGRWDGVNFKRSSPITLSNEKILEFNVWLDRWRFNMIALLEQSPESLYQTPNFSSCKGPFSLCKYFGVCKSPSETQSGILEYNFKQSEYNPLKFHD